MALALAVPNVGLACTAFLERLAALAAFPQVARSLGRLPLVARSLCCRPKWLGACVAWVGVGWLGLEVAGMGLGGLEPSKRAVDEVWKTIAKKCPHRN